MLEPESGTVSSGKVPSIMILFVLLPIIMERSRLIKANVDVR